MKTHQATAKRFKVTKKKKVLHRHCGQNHFNARDTGNATRNKRRDRTSTGADAKFVISAISKAK